eukprot:c11250_g1_i1.p1 GENE.c11250_g1_i1~~c11250_g1_i1.p1  ORF type:complete len:110 (-),score=44.51 c11250_g1_i1:14-343(-)
MERLEFLSLYRRVLRINRRCLPFQLRVLGDDYARSEFRLHKNAAPNFRWKFFNEWKMYCQMLEKREQQNDIGMNLSPEQIQALSAEQQTKLQQLREEAIKTGTKEDMNQ